MSNADQAVYDGDLEAGRDRPQATTREHDWATKRAQLSWVRRSRRRSARTGSSSSPSRYSILHTGNVRQPSGACATTMSATSFCWPAVLLTAERYDLIQDIDRWVTTRAIETIAEHNAAGQELVLEVNLSGKSVGDQAPAGPRRELQLAKTPIDPEALIFEITETAAVADIPQARRFADHLTALGCRFALDDFGAGFGSLYYLKHLPFDYLKIDGEFITGCMQGGTDQLVIEALVSIAGGLGKETIAECVEDEATQQYLRRLGVDFAQGIHVGRPTPIAPPDGGRRTRALRAVI